MVLHTSFTESGTNDKQNLDLDRILHRLALFLNTGIGLGAHDSSAPVALGFLVLVRVALLDGREQFRELGLVLLTHLCESKDGRGLDGAVGQSVLLF